jgi:hypothetical protein
MLVLALHTTLMLLLFTTIVGKSVMCLWRKSALCGVSRAERYCHGVAKSRCALFALFSRASTFSRCFPSTCSSAANSRAVTPTTCSAPLTCTRTTRAKSQSCSLVRLPCRFRAWILRFCLLRSEGLQSASWRNSSDSGLWNFFFVRGVFWSCVWLVISFFFVLHISFLLHLR